MPNLGISFGNNEREVRLSIVYTVTVLSSYSVLASNLFKRRGNVRVVRKLKAVASYIVSRRRCSIIAGKPLIIMGCIDI
jgi:hypothetical protein